MDWLMTNNTDVMYAIFVERKILSNKQTPFRDLYNVYVRQSVPVLWIIVYTYGN